jgi:hypothetical protein
MSTFPRRADASPASQAPPASWTANSPAGTAPCEAKSLGHAAVPAPPPAPATLLCPVGAARRQDITAKKTAAERKIFEIKRRKDQLLEAFIYQKAIDQETYQDQLAKLNENLVLAEMDHHSQRTDELDIEAVLAYAEKISLNAARMWLEANLEQRQRFKHSCSGRYTNRERRGSNPLSTSFYKDLESFTP